MWGPLGSWGADNNNKIKPSWKVNVHLCHKSKMNGSDGVASCWRKIAQGSRQTFLKGSTVLLSASGLTQQMGTGLKREDTWPSLWAWMFNLIFWVESSIFLHLSTRLEQNSIHFHQLCILRIGFLCTLRMGLLCQLQSPIRIYLKHSLLDNFDQPLALWWF